MARVHLARHLTLCCGLRVDEEGCEGGEDEEGRGDDEAGLQSVDEAAAVGDEGAEDGDGDGAADLTEGVEDGACCAGLFAGHAREDNGGDLEHCDGAAGAGEDQEGCHEHG
jgi:hypothetical protein